MKNPKLLPVELLSEIFSKLTTKIVGRFRCLSKPWRTYFSSSEFIKLHLTHKPNQESLIFKSRKDPNYLHVAITPSDGHHQVVSRELHIPAARHFFTVADSCNGLVMLQGPGPRDQILVVNPITLEQIIIPIQGTDTLGFKVTYGFGCDKSRCEDYKIVKISRLSESSPTYVDVYSLKDGSWKRLDDFPYSHGYRIFNLHGGVFVNGAIHWLSRRIRDDVQQHGVIVAFDLGTETFREISAPASLISRLPSCHIIVIGDCLTMVGPSSDVTRDVWIMRQYGQVDSWTKYSLASNSYQLVGYLKPLCFIGGGNEVVFLNRKGNLVVGNLTDGTTRPMIVVAESLKDIQCGCAFVDSLASPVQ